MADSSNMPVWPSRPSTRPEKSPGLDGIAVERLLRGAVLKGHDPEDLLRLAGIDPSVYGNVDESIDGREMFRLVERIREALDDAYIGFLAEGCRLALERERALVYFHCETVGESLRVSIRFTQALSADIGPQLVEDDSTPKHVCIYHTIEGVDRDIFVWFRFVWIFHQFSWLGGRPLRLRRICVRASKPVQPNGFDRFALFGCPIQYDAPFDAIYYDRKDLSARLVHSTLAEYQDYVASVPDWFATPSGGLTWRAKTERALLDFQRAEKWSASVEAVAERLRTRPRRLRRDLAREGESFQQIRTRLRGELAVAFLLVTDLPITMVGYRVGFSEPGSFTRNFSEWADMTPSEYRSRYKSDSARVAAASMLLGERIGS
ncbi:MAG TPA: AraC family transcriptional regulator ligand-binding domain-containing protein [Allosphingosinicella sp.]|nr:AraC family transcriptional regulator ligand-binding domain-containing protein [Allosphingosinicella sp.]